VKGSFDNRKSASGLVSSADATEVLLELGVKGNALGNATAGIAAFLDDYNGGDQLMDFPSFLQHYATACGIAHEKPAAAGAGVDANAPPLIWVPTRTGQWTEVDPQTAEKLLKAATPYKTHSDGISVMDESNTSPALGRDVWVRTDDVTDILMLAGVDQSEVHTAETVRGVRRFLPGMSTGKLCFQEVLCIYVAARDRPQGDSGLGAGGTTASGSGGGGLRRTAEFSKSSKPQHNAAAFADPFHGGADESVYGNARMNSKIKAKTSSAGAGGDWSLPFRATAVQIPKSTISAEFRRLDLRGEGRLNFLGLKAALELREVHLDDALIRQWLKESDKGAKGYVTFDDYEGIYTECQGGQAPTGIGISREHQRYGTLDASAGVTRSSALAKQGASTMPISSESQKQISAERRALLKRAFAKYDIDKDGFISVEDLRRAFLSQGRETPQSELVAWVRRRDISGIGAVCIEDFMQSYSQNQ